MSLSSSSHSHYIRKRPLSHRSPHIFGPHSYQESIVSSQPTGYVSFSVPTATSRTFQSPEASLLSSQHFILKQAETHFSILKLGAVPVNDLLQIIHSEGFNIDIFMHVNDLKVVVQCSEDRAIIENGFQKCTLLDHVGTLTGRAGY